MKNKIYLYTLAFLAAICFIIAFAYLWAILEGSCKDVLFALILSAIHIVLGIICVKIGCKIPDDD